MSILELCGARDSNNQHEPNLIIPHRRLNGCTMRLFNDGIAAWAVETRFGDTAKYRIKASGFRWDPMRKLWTTRDQRVVLALLSTMDDGERACVPPRIIDVFYDALRKAGKERPGAITAPTATSKQSPPPIPASDEQIRAIAASRATHSDASLPVPDGLTYLPFQKAGIAEMWRRLNDDRQRDVLLADEMGLGKTIQAIGVLNLALSEPGQANLRVLVIAPKIALRNWKRELDKWLVKPHRIEIWTTRRQPEADITIVNYDIVAKLNENDLLGTRTWDYLICDEAHALKNGEAKRTRAILGTSTVPPISAERRIFVTGTPLLNRPIELFTILHSCGAEFASNEYRYAIQYCGGDGPHGWARGHSNLDELQRKLRETVMIRRLKSDVLKDLPVKVHQVITIDPDTSAELREAVRDEMEEWDALADKRTAAEAAVATAHASGSKADIEAAVKALRTLTVRHLALIARLRHATALAKVPIVIEHVLELLCAVEGAVLVFVHHRDVAADLAHAFRESGFDPAVITGETPDADRQIAQDDIQSGKKRLFIGSIPACGVAITLSEATHVVFAEMDWTPGRMAQAEDRAHRIGQQKSVLVQYLVVNDSIDANLIKSWHGKGKIIDTALDVTGNDSDASAFSKAIFVTHENGFRENAPVADVPAAACLHGPSPGRSQPEESVADPSRGPDTEKPAFVTHNRILDPTDSSPSPPRGGEEISVTSNETSDNSTRPPSARRKRGRPSIGDRPMTAAERAKRYRAARGKHASLTISADLATRIRSAASQHYAGDIEDLLSAAIVLLEENLQWHDVNRKPQSHLRK